MKTNFLTLRQLINLVECREEWKARLFKYIYKNDLKNWGGRCSEETTIKTYSKLIDELKSKPKSKSYKFPIVVKKTCQMIEKKDFIEVCLLNLKYVKPAKGLKPWGGRNCPEGYYNCNANKYNQYFAVGCSNWSDIIDTKIIVKVKGLEWWKVLGEILWELTFYGFTEESHEKFITKLEKSLLESKRNKGKSYTLEEFKEKLKL